MIAGIYCILSWNLISLGSAFKANSRQCLCPLKGMFIIHFSCLEHRLQFIFVSREKADAQKQAEDAEMVCINLSPPSACARRAHLH